MIQTTSGSWARPRHAAMRSPARRIGSGVEQVLKSLEHSLDRRLRKCVHTHHAWLPFRRFIARTVLRKQLGAPIRDVVGAGSAAGKAFGDGAVRRLAPERRVRQAKALGHASGFRALGRLREASVYNDGPPGAEDLSGKPEGLRIGAVAHVRCVQALLEAGGGSFVDADPSQALPDGICTDHDGAEPGGDSPCDCTLSGAHDPRGDQQAGGLTRLREAPSECEERSHGRDELGPLKQMEGEHLGADERTVSSVEVDGGTTP